MLIGEDRGGRVRQLVQSADPHSSIRLQAGAWERVCPDLSKIEAADSAPQGTGPLLFHYESYSNSAFRFARRPQTAFVFHNVTPAKLLWRWAPLVACRAKAASLQLRALPADLPWIGVSPFNCEVLRSYGFKDVTYVPLVIPAHARREKTGIPTLLFVGRISPNKNQLGLLAVYERTVAALKRDIRLIVVGKRKRICRYADEFEKRLEQIQKKLDVKWIREPLRYGQLLELESSAWVYVSTSHHEGFGVPVCEAVACHTPALYFPCGGTESVLSHAGCSPDLREETLANMLCNCIEDSGAREDLLARQLDSVAQLDAETVRRKLTAAFEAIPKLRAGTAPAAARPLTGAASSGKPSSCCFVSALSRADDTRVATVARILSAEFEEFGTVMRGKPLHGGRHKALPEITRFFVPHSDFMNLAVGTFQRARNCFLAFCELSKQRPAAYFCIEPDSWAVAALCKFLYGGTLTVDLQEFYPDRVRAFPRWLQRPVRAAGRAITRLLARQTDLAVHLSKERMEAYSFLRTQSVIYALYPDASWLAVPSSAGKAGGAITFVHAGALRRSYASEELLKAMVIAAEARQDIQFVVLGGLFGEVGAPDDLGSLLRTGRLQICGSVPAPDVLRELSRAQAGFTLVLPEDTSHRFAQPRKLYEYMAAGLPVIGSDVPTIRQVVDGAGCGLLVDAAVPAQIAEAILRLAADPALRQRMGDNGRRAIEGIYRAHDEEERLINNIRAFSENGDWHGASALSR